MKLDDEIVAVLGNTKNKRIDATLASVNNSMTKTAVCLARLIDVNHLKADQPGTSQQSADLAVHALKMLAYGTSLLHSARKDQLKYVLDLSLRQKLGQNKSLQDINESHQLFGGDLQKQAKEGDILSHIYI